MYILDACWALFLLIAIFLQWRDLSYFIAWLGLWTNWRRVWLSIINHSVRTLWCLRMWVELLEHFGRRTHVLLVVGLLCLDLALLSSSEFVWVFAKGVWMSEGSRLELVGNAHHHLWSLALAEIVVWLRAQVAVSLLVHSLLATELLVHLHKVHYWLILLVLSLWHAQRSFKLNLLPLLFIRVESTHIIIVSHLHRKLFNLASFLSTSLHVDRSIEERVWMNSWRLLLTEVLAVVVWRDALSSLELLELGKVILLLLVGGAKSLKGWLLHLWSVVTSFLRMKSQNLWLAKFFRSQIILCIFQLACCFHQSF